MATVTIVRDLTVGNSDLISAHNNNVMLASFLPDDDTKVLTCKLRLVFGDTVYFDCFNYTIYDPGSGDTWYYKIELIDIVKYFMNSLYYKAVSDGINISDLVDKVQMTFYGYEDGVQTDYDSVDLYFSHGMNQIGNENGSNLKQLYDNEDLRFVAFNGYPFELYFYSNGACDVKVNINGTEAIAETSMTEGLNTAKSTGLDIIGINTVEVNATELITVWTANGATVGDWTDFDSILNVISLALYEETGIAEAYTNNISLVNGTDYYLVVVVVGEIISGGITIQGIGYNIVEGINEFTHTAPATNNIPMTLEVEADTDCSIDVGLKVNEFNQDIELYVKDNCGNGIYVRFLSKEGFYRYWLFNKYYKTSRTRSKIGRLITQVDIMADVQSRKTNIGYNEVFEQIQCVSENVSKADQEILMDLYTSPAVYMWKGEKGDASDEQDWVLVEIEGSHEIKQKSNFQNVSATIIPPELYTQKL